MAAISLLMLLVAPFVTGFIARHLLPLWLAIYAPFVGFWWWMIGRPQATDDVGGIVANGLILLSTLATSIFLAIRIWRLSIDHENKNTEFSPLVLDWRLLWATATSTIVILFGEKLRIVGVQLFGVYGLIVAIALASIGLMIGSVFFSKRIVTESCYKSGNLRATMQTLSVLLAAILIWSLYMPHKVAADAQRLAGKGPYCIQIADGKAHYRPAKSLLDLSPLVMQSDRGLQFHSVVIFVDDFSSTRNTNWSYFKGAFDRKSIRRATLYNCEPSTSFAYKLPIADNKLKETQFVGLGSKKFQFPIDMIESVKDSSSSIHLNLDRGSRQVKENQILSRLRGSASLKLYREGEYSPFSGIRNKIEYELESRYGLEKIATRYRVLRILKGTDGNIQSSLECDMDQVDQFYRKGICRHQFLRQGIIYKISYPDENLKNWKLIETETVKMFDRFKIKT